MGESVYDRQQNCENGWKHEVLNEVKIMFATFYAVSEIDDVLVYDDDDDVDDCGVVVMVIMLIEND